MIEFILNLIGLTLEGKKFKYEQLEKKSAVVSSLKAALRSTKKHIIDTRTNYGDIESVELAEKWTLAAQFVRPYNSELAEVLEMKGEYWVDPNGFKYDLQNGDHKFDFRMRLDKMENIIKEIEKDWKKL